MLLLEPWGWQAGSGPIQTTTQLGQHYHRQKGGVEEEERKIRVGREVTGNKRYNVAERGKVASTIMLII